MGDISVIEITRQAIIVLIIISTPPLLIAMGVGLAISLVQALTQIQESTIAFVPKILILFASLIFLVPFMAQQMVDFGLLIGPMIIEIGGTK